MVVRLVVRVVVRVVVWVVVRGGVSDRAHGRVRLHGRDGWRGYGWGWKGGGGGVGVWCWLPHVLVLCNNTGTRETTNIQVVTQGRSHNS